MAQYHMYFALLLAASVFVVELYAVDTEQTLLAEEILSADQPRECRPMRKRPGKMCKRFGYDRTLVPNLLNHDNQRDAYHDLLDYSHLIQSECSSHLLFLLCAFHFPRCSNDTSESPALVLPCRSVCESVRDQCLPTMTRRGLTWPDQMQCEKLQDDPFTTVEGENVTCVSPDPVSDISVPCKYLKFL